MLQIIQSCLYGEELYEEVIIGLSKVLLSNIEGAGMLPPPSTIFNTDLDNNPTWEPETCGTCEKHCGNDWCVTKENGDEKK